MILQFAFIVMVMALFAAALRHVHNATKRGLEASFDSFQQCCSESLQSSKRQMRATPIRHAINLDSGVKDELQARRKQVPEIKQAASR